MALSLWVIEEVRCAELPSTFILGYRAAGSGSLDLIACTHLMTSGPALNLLTSSSSAGFIVLIKQESLLSGTVPRTAWLRLVYLSEKLLQDVIKSYYHTGNAYVTLKKCLSIIVWKKQVDLPLLVVFKYKSTLSWSTRRTAHPQEVCFTHSNAALSNRKWLPNGSR